MTRGIYKVVLKEYRRTLTKVQRRNSYRTKIQWHYPYAIERKFYSLIKAVFQKYSSKLTNRIMLGEKAYPVQAVRRDSFESDIDLYIRSLVKELEALQLKGELLTSLNLTPVVIQIMNTLKQFSEHEIENYFVKRFGKPIAYSDPWWTDLTKTWNAEFEMRLAGSTDAFMYKIRDTVIKYTQQEKTFEELVKKISEISQSFTDKQAAFLARDLTGKLNGLITKNLQTTLGLNYYYWQTAADERVRGRPGGRYANALPSHWDMNGTVCSWIDVSKVSYDYGRSWSSRTSSMPFTHPGMAWQCRCVAAPFDLDLLLQVDRELASEGA